MTSFEMYVDQSVTKRINELNTIKTLMKEITENDFKLNSMEDLLGSLEGNLRPGDKDWLAKLGQTKGEIQKAKEQMELILSDEGISKIINEIAEEAEKDHEEGENGIGEYLENSVTERINELNIIKKLMKEITGNYESKLNSTEQLLESLKGNLRPEDTDLLAELGQTKVEIQKTKEQMESILSDGGLSKIINEIAEEAEKNRKERKKVKVINEINADQEAEKNENERKKVDGETAVRETFNGNQTNKLIGVAAVNGGHAEVGSMTISIAQAYFSGYTPKEI